MAPETVADVGPAVACGPPPDTVLANELEFGSGVVSEGRPPPVSFGAVGTFACKLAAKLLFAARPLRAVEFALDRISLSTSGCPPPEARLCPASDTSFVAPVSKVDEPCAALTRPDSAFEAALI